jgi:5-methyltetrahydropteroyltriglutamate--homocysteine methyltransferase
MKRSDDRILTTHTGSLPRPETLLSLVRAKERGQPVDNGTFSEEVSAAVRAIVRRQADAGIDVISDGEMSKVSYATYVKDRLTGFHGEGRFPIVTDLADYPAYAARELGSDALRELKLPVCTGDISYVGEDSVRSDIQTLKSALEGVQVEEAFLTAASPGVISLFLENQHYATHEAYLFALADAMRHEYEMICDAGLLLQVDCPDLAMGRHIQYANLSVKEFRKKAEMHVEALNHALANVPSEWVRMHLCWANYEGPHHRDVDLLDIVDIVLRARPAAVSFVAANPRHEHEWKVWKDVPLPPGKILIPGILDSTTNFIEHPDLVAERIERFANLVGPENVIAGTDCGFSTFAGLTTVDPAITWAKLAALSEGARRASERVFQPHRRALVALGQSRRWASKHMHRLARRENAQAH